MISSVCSKNSCPIGRLYNKAFTVKNYLGNNVGTPSSAFKTGSLMLECVCVIVHSYICYVDTLCVICKIELVVVCLKLVTQNY